MENSAIEWCDHTFNPWIGCSKVSPACDGCYAEELMDTRYGRVEWGGDRVKTGPSNWAQPLKWNRAAELSGAYTTVFCLSLGDIWDKDANPAWRYSLVELIERTPALTWLLLSKRIGNAEKMCDPMAGNNRPLPPNAALGATMIDQEEWDRDYPKLKRAGQTLGAKFIFASIEPMLGPIDMHGDVPDWVIAGGESGSKARASHPDWFRSLRDQSAKAGKAFLFKQWGEYAPADPQATSNPRSGWVPSKGAGFPRTVSDLYPENGAAFVERVGKKAAGRKLDGVTHDGYPA